MYISLLAVLAVFTLLTVSAGAQTLASDQYFVWGISDQQVQIPAGSVVTEAVLTIHNLSPADAPLAVHLLDNPAAGTAVGTDPQQGNIFEGYGVPLTGTVSGGDWTCRLSQVNHPDSPIWNVYSSPFVFTLADGSSVSYSSALLEFMDYIGNGGGFGFGLDCNSECTWSDIDLTLTINSFETVQPAQVIQLAAGDSSIHFEEDFSSGNLSGWTVKDATESKLGPSDWTITGGMLVQSTNIYKFADFDALDMLGTYLFLNAGMNWTDYQMQFTMRSLNSNSLGVVFRYQDDQNYYRFAWNRKRSFRQLVKCVNGRYSLLAQDSVPYTVGQDYSMQISVQGDRIQVFANDQMIFNVSDNSLSAGTIGFYCWGNGGSCFDDLLVEGFPAPAAGNPTQGLELPYSNDGSSADLSGWTVVDAPGALGGPSVWEVSGGMLVQSTYIYMYADYDALDMLGSYLFLNGGEDWTNYTLQFTMRSLNSNSLGVVFRYQDDQNYYRFAWNRKRGFRQIVKCMNGQYTLLAQDSVPYVVGQSYSVQIKVEGDLIQAFVGGKQIFSVHDGSLSAGTIGLYCWGNQGSCFDDILVEEIPVDTDTQSSDPQTPVTSYTEDFSDGDLSGWTIVDAAGTKQGPSVWTVSGGTLIQSTDIYKYADFGTLDMLGTQIYLNEGLNWTDYTLQMKMRSQDDDALGIVFRYQNSQNYYRFAWNQQRNFRQLVKCVDGQFTLLAQDSVPYSTGRDYTVRIETAADQILVFVDGKQIFNVRDGSLGTGTIGMYCWGNQGSCFDDVSVLSQ